MNDAAPSPTGPSVSRRAAILGGTAVAAVSATAGAVATDRVLTHRSPTYRVSPMPQEVREAMAVRVVWHAGPAAAPVAHLTFDDGPSRIWTPKILKILADHDATATFFMLHEFITAHPDVVRMVHAGGHELAVHGGDHTDMTTLETAELTGILAATRKAIHDLTGVLPTRMRPPYGRLDAPVLEAIQRAGLEEATLWSHRTGASRPEAEQVLAHASSGMIVLSHDGRSSVDDAELDAITWVASRLRSQGYALTSLAGAA